MERIDRLLTIAEVRRNAVFREIDRHRSSLARPLRDSIEKIDDAAFYSKNPKASSRNIGG